jgi:hypothetical protein
VAPENQLAKLLLRGSSVLPQDFRGPQMGFRFQAGWRRSLPVHNPTVTEPGLPPLFTDLGKIEIDGEEIDIGNLVLQVSPNNKLLGQLVGPAKITPLLSTTDPRGASAQGAPAQSIAACFFSADGTVHI